MNTLHRTRTMPWVMKQRKKASSMLLPLALLLTPMTAFSTDICEPFEKQVWDPSAQMWKNADTKETAVNIPVGEPVEFRYIVSNCEVDKQCFRTTVQDNDPMSNPAMGLKIPPTTIPGGPGLPDGELSPGDIVFVEGDTPDFGNLLSKDWCDTPGLKLNIGEERTFIEGEVGPEINKDPAWVNCEGGPAPECSLAIKKTCMVQQPKPPGGECKGSKGSKGGKGDACKGGKGGKGSKGGKGGKGGKGMTVNKKACTVAKGDTVKYNYKVTNKGDSAIPFVWVADDKLGIIGLVENLGPGLSNSIMKEVKISKTVTNLGYAAGFFDVEDDKVCSALSEPVIVKVKDPCKGSKGGKGGKGGKGSKGSKGGKGDVCKGSKGGKGSKGSKGGKG